MTTLHDKMSDAVADVTTDFSALTSSARRRGLAIRRRRAALSSIGAVAAVTVLGLGWYALSPTHRSTTTIEPGSATPSAPALPDPLIDRTAGQATDPLTGRSLAAALSLAVTDEVSGKVSDFAGEGSAHSSYAELFSENSTGSGMVGITVEGLFDLPRDCSQTFMLDCTLTPQADGDTLRTYVDEASDSTAGAKHYVGELLSTSKDLRVVVTATNTDVDGKVVGEVPVLSIDQAALIAVNTTWGLRLPSTFTQAGAALSSYVDLLADSENQSSSAK